MIPPNLKFWSISRKESLASEQGHALTEKFSRALLCSNNKFVPGYNPKMVKRKRTSFLAEVCFNYEQLFHPVQSIAGKICQGNSIYIMVLPRVSGIVNCRTTSLSLRRKLFRQRFTTIFNLSVLVLKSTYTFFLPLNNVHFRQGISSLESVFSMPGSCCSSTTVSGSFPEEVFGVVSTTW